ncbi:MAG: hypothetical protein SOR72_01100 [Hornefia sp.]|nr:hypothetical protein [Hornefia sp.]
MIVKKVRNISIITAFVVILLTSIPMFTYAGTKDLPKKSFTKVVGIESGGWVTIRTNLSGSLTYKDSKTKRTFTKESYFMYATSANDRSIVKRAKVSMGIMTLHAGGKVYKCYRAKGRYPYYVNPNWIAHSYTVSKTKAIGKLKGKSYAKLGFSIYGNGVVTPRSDTAIWHNIAK